MCKVIELGERLKNSLSGASIDAVTKEVDKRNLEKANKLVDRIKGDLLAELVEVLNEEVSESKNLKLHRVPISEIANCMLPGFVTLNTEIRGKLNKLSIVCKSESSCYIILFEERYLETYRIDMKIREHKPVLCKFTDK